MNHPGAPTWRLLDAVAQHEAHPRSFFIPSVTVREGLEPGDLAKLVFQAVDAQGDGPGAERMWVEVTDRAPGGYVGRLANQPLAIPDLAPGGRVEFEPRHVVDVHDDTPDPFEALAAFASERLFDDDDPGVHVASFDPREVGREIAGGRRLSGWSLLAGDETQDDVDDPDRIRLPSLSWLLQRHPELHELVIDHDGSEGSWVRGDDDWTPA